MISIVKLLRNGSLEVIEIDKNENLDNLSNYINNDQTNVEELDIIERSNYNLKIVGSNNKHLLMENKHEFPIKYNIVYYGDLLVLKCSKDNVIVDLKLEEYTKLLSI